MNCDVEGLEYLGKEYKDKIIYIIRNGEADNELYKLSYKDITSDFININFKKSIFRIFVISYSTYNEYNCNNNMKLKLYGKIPDSKDYVYIPNKNGNWSSVIKEEIDKVYDYIFSKNNPDLVKLIKYIDKIYDKK